MQMGKSLEVWRMKMHESATQHVVIIVPTCNKAFAALRTMNRAPKASFQISQRILGPERKSWDYGRLWVVVVVVVVV